VVDAGRDERGVLGLQCFGLCAGYETRLAFNHNVQRVGGVEAAAFLRLPRLQADQVADQARPVEEGDTDGTLLEKPPGAADVDDVHAGS
jgi:hypothetical protein